MSENNFLAWRFSEGFVRQAFAIVPSGVSIDMHYGKGSFAVLML